VWGSIIAFAAIKKDQKKAGFWPFFPFLFSFATRLSARGYCRC